MDTSIYGEQSEITEINFKKLPLSHSTLRRRRKWKNHLPSPCHYISQHAFNCEIRHQDTRWILNSTSTLLFGAHLPGVNKPQKRSVLLILLPYLYFTFFVHFKLEKSKIKHPEWEKAEEEEIDTLAHSEG